MLRVEKLITEAVTEDPLELPELKVPVDPGLEAPVLVRIVMALFVEAVALDLTECGDAEGVELMYPGLDAIMLLGMDKLAVFEELEAEIIEESEPARSVVN